MAVKCSYWYLTEPVIALARDFKALCAQSDLLQEPVVMGFGVLVCICCYECLFVYLHTDSDRFFPWGHCSEVLTPVPTVIRDITFNVNVVMALNQPIALF